MSPGEVTIDNRTFRDIIQEYYRLKGYQLTGEEPGWLASEDYDIVATAKGNPTGSQMEAMVQTLLADRLQLKFHWVTKKMQGCALIVANDGPKFHEHPEAAGGDQSTANHERQSVDSISGRRITMAHLADYLTNVMQVPVLNQTNLGGMYEFALGFIRDGKLPGDPGLKPDSIPAALQDQLGLKLVKESVPVQVFVIDHIEKPSGN